MSGVKMELVVLRNFKCHKEFKVGLSELNILTGSNAAGKSSFIQAILLAFQSWEEYDKKIINTNYIYGVNLGIPSSIVSENSDGKDIILEIVCGDSINKAVLGVDEDNGNDMHVKILNSEDIAVQRGEHHNLKQMNLFFLNAERQGPRVVSAIQKIQPNFVGYAGENTGYMISEMDKRQKLRGIKLPDGLKISALDRFSANCEAWLDVVVPNTELQCSVDMERNLSMEDKIDKESPYGGIIPNDAIKVKRNYLKRCRTFQAFEDKAKFCFPRLIFHPDAFCHISKLGKCEDVVSELIRHLCALNDYGDKIYAYTGKNEKNTLLELQSFSQIYCSGKGSNETMAYHKDMVFKGKKYTLTCNPHTKLFKKHSGQRIYFCWGRDEIEGHKIIIVRIGNHWEE